MLLTDIQVIQRAWNHELLDELCRGMSVASILENLPARASNSQTPGLGARLNPSTDVFTGPIDS